MSERKMKNNIKTIAIKERFSMDARIVFLTVLALFSVAQIAAQDSEALEKAKEKALSESKGYTYEGNEILSESDDAVAAEVEYRKAIAKSSANAKAKYNLGNVYYKDESMGEAFMRYKEAGTTAETKEERHSAYHNLGNVFMKNKEYQKAVEAYKEALRNDPSDEETRYNLALAKEMLKKQQDENKDNQNKDDQNQDENKDNQDNQDQNQDDQDKKDGDEGEDKKDDQGEEGDENKEGDNKDEQGENPEDKNQDEGKNDKQDQQKQNPEGKPEEQQQQPRPDQLSPQQVRNILEAMNNEEKKVQEKVNAEKIKGAPVKSEKDW
ncbi:tetratricopeptide repeat protein [Joostella atrarenae]|uniref:Tetratricopeptide repeat protein n=1 Tax=Joostella atrarenae TaxID=679257 RepID=A0ABS9J049_9FLAO|nr:tetratricopeptide repeat protein [Joostella atrarenae]MCF8713808.1 tetratricopeptide repeat protein [Joostella atrarenae]